MPTGIGGGTGKSLQEFQEAGQVDHRAGQDQE
jgi:hypothetical protein